MASSDFGNQLNKTFDEVFKQTDRASAIVSTALLEELLERLLLAYLIDHVSVKRDLFEGIAPVSTMSAKINLAYYLGLLDQNEFDDLKLIKKIRNDFAHSFEGINFDTPRIKDKCLLLKTLKSTNPPKVAMDNIKNVKTFFKINTTLLASILYFHIEEIKHAEPHKHRVDNRDGIDKGVKTR